MTAAPIQIGGVNVSRETEARLQSFQLLALKWNSRINLFSAQSTEGFWQRHIADSCQIYPLAPPTATEWLDIGSGGGAPAIVLATLLAELRPNARMTMIESDQRKAAFLRTASRELELNCSVLAQRVETTEPLNAQVLTARALAPLSVLLAHAERHLAPGGVAIFPKGRNAAAEIDAVRGTWRFDLIETPSITDPDARILRIERIARA